MGDYAYSRQGMAYYGIARQWVAEVSPGNAILDIGSGGTDVVCAGDYRARHAIDRRLQDVPGVTHYQGQWPSVVGPLATYHTVVCLQVIEHLTDDEVAPFMNRLHTTWLDTLIVSTSHKWPRGACQHHNQDPIDSEKLLQLLDTHTVPLMPSMSSLLVDEKIVVDGRRERILMRFA